MHISRQKERLLSILSDLNAHSQGKCIILTFDEDIGSALRKACNIDDMQCTWHILHTNSV